MLFMNPNNEKLIHATSIMLGRKHGLGQEILTSLTEFKKLKAKFKSQVEVRIYDCCPPCSIFGYNPKQPDAIRQYFIVEQYLFDLPYQSRPCLTVTRENKKYFDLYKDSLERYFSESSEYQSEILEPGSLRQENTDREETET